MANELEKYRRKVEEWKGTFVLPAEVQTYYERGFTPDETALILQGKERLIMKKRKLKKVI